MKRLFAFILVLALWFNLAPAASAESVAGLVPCSESPAYEARAASFLNTTADPQSGQKRAKRYAEALCGEEGLPHLIVDGRFSHAGDFLIPAILFLYIAGWIGWAGRSYLIAVRGGKNPEMKEVVIDVPLAFSKMLAASTWPMIAFKDYTSGNLIAKDGEIPISPR